MKIAAFAVLCSLMLAGCGGGGGGGSSPAALSSGTASAATTAPTAASTATVAATVIPRSIRPRSRSEIIAPRAFCRSATRTRAKPRFLERPRSVERRTVGERRRPNVGDKLNKIAVQGSVSWPAAANSSSVQGVRFVIVSNGLPVGRDDPARSSTCRDRSGIPIRPESQQDRRAEFDLRDSVQSGRQREPDVPRGNGRDLDQRRAAIRRKRRVGARRGCPRIARLAARPPGNDQREYHYHSITSCIPDQPDATGHSSLVGYAFDGFGIYGNLGVGGQPMTDATLDLCHGHTLTRLCFTARCK